MNVRPFVVVDTDGFRVLDLATSLVHIATQALPAGRTIMDGLQVHAWPQDATLTQLVAQAPAIKLAAHAHIDDLLASLVERGFVALHLTHSTMNQHLPPLTARARHHGLAVIVSTSAPGLAPNAEQLAAGVDTFRVRLHAPTEDIHDLEVRAGQASYREALAGVRAAVGESTAVELVMPVDPALPPEVARRRITDLTVRACQLRACGITLLPGRGAARGGTVPVPPARQHLRTLLDSCDTAPGVRVHIAGGSAEFPLEPPRRRPRARALTGGER